MATVRIYKVAELLNTTSQEVIALLKRDHGIEVKSASSTIEEVVAREFVGRLARQRGGVRGPPGGGGGQKGAHKPLLPPPPGPRRGGAKKRGRPPPRAPKTG